MLQILVRLGCLGEGTNPMRLLWPPPSPSKVRDHSHLIHTTSHVRSVCLYRCQKMIMYYISRMYMYASYVPNFDRVVCLSVGMPVCLYVCLSVCLYVYVYVCLSACPYVCRSICTSVCMCVCLSICLCVCLSVCLPVCMLVYMHVYLSATD